MTFDNCVKEFLKAAYRCGRSVEHEISVISAIQAIHAVDKDHLMLSRLYHKEQRDVCPGEHIGGIEAY